MSSFIAAAVSKGRVDREEVLHGLRLYLDMGVGIGGNKFPAANMFCYFIQGAQWVSFFTKLFTGRRVIELGSGNGMAGLLVDKLFDPSEVLITDLADLVPHIEHNLSLNECLTRSSSLTFDWAAPPENLGKFDIVLVFECFYKQELYGLLIAAIDAVAHENTVIFLGLNRLFVKPRFFEQLLQAGFKYTMVPQECMPPQYGSETNDRDVGLFIVSRANKPTR